MHIRMLKTENGSVDGIRVKQYPEGEEFDLTGTAGERDLAAAFVGAGLAEEVGVKVLELPHKAVETEVSLSHLAALSESVESAALPSTAAKSGRKPRNRQ